MHGAFGAVQRGRGKSYVCALASDGLVGRCLLVPDGLRGLFCEICEIRPGKFAFLR